MAFHSKGHHRQRAGPNGLGLVKLYLEILIGSRLGLQARKIVRFLPNLMSNKSIYTNTVVDDQYNEIISSGDAWLVAEEVNGDDVLHDLKPTNSSRRIKSLVEQVTGQLTPILFLHQLSNWSVQTATLNFLVQLREHYFLLKFNCLCWTLTILGYQHPLTHLKLFPLFLFAQCLALCQ